MTDYVQELKSFSTSRHNLGNSPVRRRCREFDDAMRALGYTCLPIEEAIELFQATLGIMDRASLKAYFGTQPHRAKQCIERMARYASGAVSLKRIELSHKVGYTPGYFELLRLATIQKKGDAWFLVLNEVSIIPELGRESLMKDCANKSNVEISLSPISINEQCKGPLTIRVNDSRETTEKREREREYRCRERNPLWTSEKPETAKPEICPELQLLMAATPVETAEKCVQCGRVDESNPYRIWCPKGGGERSKSDVCIVEASQ
jgi:hypothetical protein